MYTRTSIWLQTMGLRAKRWQILLSTAVLMGALSGYGGGAYAACVTGAPPSVVCSASNTSQQTINLSNATVSTAPGFSVVTGNSNGLRILGAGSLSYTDVNASTLTATTFGLFIRNTASATGGVTVETNGALTGATSGLDARNLGGGALMVTATGDVTGTANRGIFAQNGSSNSPAGTDITLIIGAGANVKGENFGVRTRNFGTGILDLTINGDVTGVGAGSRGIFARNETGSSHLNLTTAAGTTVLGGNTGIRARNDGSGALIAVIDGNVTGTSNDGIYAQNFGTELSLTIGAGSMIMGGIDGIEAVNAGSGALTLKIDGNVTGGLTGIFAEHTSGGPVEITVGSVSTVTGNGAGATDFGIQTSGGPANVTLAGTVNGGAGGAIEFDQVTGRNNRLELVSGAIINGDVFGGSATDTLVLSGPGTGNLNISQLQNFDIASKEGASHWTLTGANAGITDFAVNDGVLSVNASLPNAAFAMSGGTLTGTGSLGGLTVNGGIVAPGNSIGALTVNGNFTLTSGAVYEVEVNAAGANDQVIVNGIVDLTGSTLRVLAANGNYNTKTDYVIIDNDGSDAVAGTFATITSNLAFLTPLVVYNGGTGNDVVLTLTRKTVPGAGDGGTGGGRNRFLSFCSVTDTINQCNVAYALDIFPTTNVLFLDVLGQTAEGARQAFDALSGEVHATVSGVLADDSRYVREAIMGRLTQAGHSDNSLGAGGPQVASLDSHAMALAPLAGDTVAGPSSSLAFWTRAYGAWGDHDGDRNAATADRDLGGFISGMDANIAGSWRVGLAAGASYSNIDVSDRNSSADVDSFNLAGYAGGMAGAFAVRGGGAWAWNDIDTSRAVVFPGFFERQKASYDADTGQIFGEIAYPTEMAGMSVEPFAGLAYISVDTETFRERGGALASLRGRDTDQDVGYSTLGLRAASTMHWGETLVIPHISVAWQHAFDDVTPGAALAFASTGIGFDVTGVPLAEDSALIDAGLDFALGERTTAGVSYSGQYGDGVQDNAVKGRFTWLF